MAWWIMEEYFAELELLLIKHLGKAETTGNWVDYVKVKYLFIIWIVLNNVET